MFSSDLSGFLLFAGFLQNRKTEDLFRGKTAGRLQFARSVSFLFGSAAGVPAVSRDQERTGNDRCHAVDQTHPFENICVDKAHRVVYKHIDDKYHDEGDRKADRNMRNDRFDMSYDIFHDPSPQSFGI